MVSRRGRVLSLLAPLTLGCTDLHFTHEAALDFERYGVATVSLTTEDPVEAPVPAGALDALLARMRAVSGFQTVLGPGDGGEPDLWLEVALVGVDDSISSGVALFCDCEAELELTVGAEVIATDAAGQRVGPRVSVEGSASDSYCTALPEDACGADVGIFTPGERRRVYVSATDDALLHVAGQFLPSLDL